MVLCSSSFISLTFTLFILSLLRGSRSASLPCIGVTYSAESSTADTHLPPERIVTAINSLKFGSLRLEDSDPNIIRAFSYSNNTLFLIVPNYMVPEIAANRSNALRWLYVHVVPFYPRAKITTISVGNDFVDVYPQSVDRLLSAMRNIHSSLHDLGIRKIAVSTSFSFIRAISTPFPPSAAQFQNPSGVDFVGPLLQFLRETNSSFLINVYPYNLYRLKSEIPIGIALFQEHAFNFRDDLTTGVRYSNLFDMMIDAVVSAMAVEGYENIPIIVTETGWPSDSVNGNEVEANMAYAEVYLKGLVRHLKSGVGTPLRKEGVAEVYLYELFDKEKKQGTKPPDRNWGILYPNATKKYNIDFSGSLENSGAKSWMKMAIEISLVLVLSL
ncbi:hypothetical protein L6164_030035 [Bauhinia variegata]|uniref:Uncharacterized protein n=1 Tax=Bauhinia variegata TaxID=167791 RepID=A0ACB9LB13_BAUVA|nr:hypothetical protein L6164_030035 [Bauhinia variegata]